MAPRDIQQKLFRFEWSCKWQGLRVKEILREVLPELGSRGAMLVVRNELVRDGERRVVSSADAVLPAGTVLQVDLRHGIHGKGRPDHPPLHERMHVHHDDESLTVVTKLAGTLVHAVEDGGPPPSKRTRTAPLVDLLRQYWRANRKPVVQPILVQRLDLDTSGLLVVAKTSEAAAALQSQLKPPRKMRREYLALVAGEFQTTRGTWKTWLGRGPIGLRQSVADDREDARRPREATLAETHFSVEERFDGMTLLRLQLATGKTHQIRIHCAEAGHPILADPVYTKLAENVIDRMTKGKINSRAARHPFAELRKLVASGVVDLRLPKKLPPRLALHATRLSFVHPETGKRMDFEDALPKELAGYLKRLVAKD